MTDAMLGCCDRVVDTKLKKSVFVCKHIHGIQLFWS